MGMLDRAMHALSQAIHPYTCDQAVCVTRVMKQVRSEALEEAARLHENVDVTDGRDPMAVAIDYRDRIRALAHSEHEAAKGATDAD